MRSNPSAIALISFLIASFAALTQSAPADTLVPAGATWRYLDNGGDPGSTWRTSSFDDSSWSAGAAELGYGDGGEATVVGFGPNSSAKYITTYFRHSFNVADPAAYSGLRLRVLRDDGVVVYLNGVEVFRDNLPTGNITSSTLATTAIADTGETTFLESSVAASGLVAGANLLAVEIHQANGTSSDISFNLELLGNTGAGTIVRGPYLQQGTPSSVTVRWRTDLGSDSRVRFGTDPATLDQSVVIAGTRTEHSVTVTDLQPATRYYYELGNALGWFSGDSQDYFVTSPTPGTPQSTRLWVLGDSGTANADAAAVRNAYLNFSASRPADLVLMLGDNAYNNGTDAEYQAAVFNMYPTVLQNTVLWPTRGNHEYDGGGTGSTYYNIFTMPRNGEAGGVASGTEAYYSFDYGNIHFICLDSQGTSRSASGPMATWLQADLASTTQPWVIAFWHHPPYTKGSHNSDTEVALIEMRTNFLPLLEDGGVDLVLCGHSHSYERSFLLDSHYGLSTTLTAGMKIDGGSGREDGTGAYQKPAGRAAHQGAVYAVTGSAGKISGGSLNHPAMFISLNALGSMVLDISGSRLDAGFLQADGTMSDYFTILKASPMPPATPGNLAGVATSSSRIDLAWNDQSDNEDGFRVERSIDNSNFEQIAATPAGTTSHADTTVLASTTYYYRVLAYNSAGASAYTAVATVSTPAPPAVPAAPTSLTATAISATQILLNWSDNADNEEGYQVERSTNQFDWIALVPALAPNSTSATDAGAAPGTTYHYRVRAFNDGGLSEASNQASATSFIDSVAVSETPVFGTVAGAYGNTHSDDGQFQQVTEVSSGGKPSNRHNLLEHQWAFTVTPGRSVTLHVQAYRTTSSDGDSFVLAYSADGSTYTDMLTIEATSDTGAYQTFSLPGSLNGTIHVRVRDTDRATGKNGLDTVSFDHLFIRTDVTPVTTPPLAPTGQSAMAGDQAVTLNWSPSDGATSYRIYRSLIPGSYGAAPHAEVSSVMQYVDTVDVINGTTYYYVITAVNNYGESGASGEVSATPQALSGPLPPSNLSATPGKKRNTLAWTQSSSAGVTENRIYRSTDNQNFQLIATVAPATSFNDTGLASGATYYYFVTALSAAGESDSSNVAFGTAK